MTYVSPVPPKTTDGSELQTKLTDLDGNGVSFIVEGIDLGLANAVRRTMMADIPTLAIETVWIEENTSVLPDEFLSHRLGLIPLDSLNMADHVSNYRADCDCDSYCDKCSIELTLNAYCSMNSEGPMDVRSRDLIPSLTSDQLGRGNVGTPLKDILICKLGRNQSLKIKCLAVKGIAVEHNKWSPCSAVGFEYDPYNRLKHTDLWFEVGTKPEDEWPLSKNAQFERPPEPDEPFDYMQPPSRFYYDVEGVGSLPPKDIVTEGLKGLVFKLDGIRSSLEGFLQSRPIGQFDGGVAGAGGGTAYGGFDGGAGGGGRTTYGGTTPFGGGGGRTPMWGGGSAYNNIG